MKTNDSFKQTQKRIRDEREKQIAKEQRELKQWEAKKRARFKKGTREVAEAEKSLLALLTDPRVPSFPDYLRSLFETWGQIKASEDFKPDNTPSAKKKAMDMVAIFTGSNVTSARQLKSAKSYTAILLLIQPRSGAGNMESPAVIVPIASPVINGAKIDFSKITLKVMRCFKRRGDRIVALHTIDEWGNPDVSEVLGYFRKPDKLFRYLILTFGNHAAPLISHD